MQNNPNQGKLPTVTRHLANMSNFMPQISPFDGDPSMLNFFFTQIRELANINSWNSQKAVSFFKSKLCGAALKFYIQSEQCQNATQLDELDRIFKSFFVHESHQTSILELASFSLLPGESIRSLAHRLDNLVQKIYHKVNDKSSILAIKHIHLVKALPVSISNKLLEENVDNYECAVKRAQQLQDIYANNSNNAGNSKLDELTKQVQNMSEKINFINQTNDTQDDKNKYRDRKIDERTDRSNFQRRGRGRGIHYNHRPNRNFFSQKHTTNTHVRDRPHGNLHFQNRNNQFVITCQFCGLRGHHLARCFKFKKMMNEKNSSGLNPNAPTFSPNLNHRRS